MTEEDLPSDTGLNSNDLLFNLTLLNGLAAAVLAGLSGVSVGLCFGIGMGVALVVMPLILSVSWLILLAFQHEDRHAALANIVLILTLLGLIAFGVVAFAT